MEHILHLNHCGLMLPIPEKIKMNLQIFKKKFEDISPFCGATDTPVLDFWWCLLWVSKQEWEALFMPCRGIAVTCSLSFTSGVTPAASCQPAWQLSHSLPHTCKKRHWWGSKPGSTMPPLSHNVTLLTELCRLGWTCFSYVDRLLLLHANEILKYLGFYSPFWLLNFIHGTYFTSIS